MWSLQMGSVWGWVFFLIFFHLFKCSWGYMLHVEHMSCVITNCVRYQWIIPSLLSMLLCNLSIVCNQCEGIIILIPYHLMQSLQLEQLLGTGTLSSKNLHGLDWNYIGTMKTSWTCKAGTQLFDVVTTTHMENRWGWGFLFVCFRVFRTSNNFLAVDGLVIWLRYLAVKIVVDHIISMWDI